FFAITLFVSAALLFVVQPMFARMVLPLWGGSPSVWNTCNFFFQAALLAGYGYSYFSSRRLEPKMQAVLHLAILLAVLLLLPIGVDMTESVDSTVPTLELLGVLTISLGLPLFAVATSAPLLQFWFGHSGHPRAHDPYFLYAASNLGSLLA